MDPQPTTSSDAGRADTTKQMIDVLRPVWQPNDIIKMFHEERAKIEQRGIECKNLLTETDQVLKEALNLKDLYSFISPRTSQLHSECKNLIKERNDLRESYEKINYTLNKQEELRSILKRMPEIKNQVFAILHAVSHSFQAKQQPSAGHDNDQTHNNHGSEMTPLEDYYGRFFVECRRIKDLTLQLESCLSCANTEELTFYLEEIYRLYVDIREQLMGPVYTKKLQRLVEKANRNFCDLLQQLSASLVRILRNEIQLFQQVFPTQQHSLPNTPNMTTDTSVVSHTNSDSLGEGKANPSSYQHVEESNASVDQIKQTDALKRQALKDLLELLCRIFYDHLRPVVIHVNHLETLAELYKLINETIRLEFNNEAFQSTMDTLAEDVQERMVFRTEVFIQESILDYKPSQGDLAYPEKFDLIPGGDLNDYQSMWYPTVQRTVLALLYLKRVFDNLTFSELAQELVAACYKSLDVAQHLVDERHGGSKIEASVFLSKHSAIIVNQLQSYGIDQSSLVPPPPLFATQQNTIVSSTASIEQKQSKPKQAGREFQI